jgi:hypothetical protein
MSLTDFAAIQTDLRKPSLALCLSGGGFDTLTVGPTRAGPAVALPRFIEIDGRRYLWRDLVALRCAQAIPAAQQPVLFALREDHRPAGERGKPDADYRCAGDPASRLPRRPTRQKADLAAFWLFVIHRRGDRIDNFCRRASRPAATGAPDKRTPSTGR